jgi:patatin-like phospholipase/acyl hydrolase
LFPKYRSDGLRELLATYIPDVTLADVWTERNKGIVTPSFQLSAVVPSGARQWAARLLNNLPNVGWMSGTKAIDAILASAAAPVYFQPHELPLTPGGNAFVDGGIFANDAADRRPRCFMEIVLDQPKGWQKMSPSLGRNRLNGRC